MTNRSKMPMYALHYFVQSLLTLCVYGRRITGFAMARHLSCILILVDQMQKLFLVI